MQVLSKLNLGIKINFALVVIFVILVGAVGGALTLSFDQFSESVARSRFDEETTVIQQQMVQAEERAIADTHALANLGRIAQAIETDDNLRISLIISEAAPTYQFDEIIVVDAQGERIVAETVTEASENSSLLRENLLIQFGLIGIETAGLTYDPLSTDEAPGVMLAAVSTVRNDAGIIVGAVLTGRAITDEFLAELNFNRTDIHIGFIFENQLVAQHVAGQNQSVGQSANLETGNIELTSDEVHSDIVAEASSGSVVYVGVLDNRDGVPYSVGLVPITIGDSRGSMLLEISLENISEFRSDSISSTALIIVVLGLVGVGVLGLILYLLVIRGLTRLQTAATEMTAGHYDNPVPIRVQDEIGRLGAAFNMLAVEVQQRETQLQNLNKSLEQQVMDRTKELESALVEAREAREAAEKSDQIKSAFLASMSHELRTPLNAVINLTKFVAQGDLGSINAQQEHALLNSVDSARHLLNLINDVLDMSKIEADALSLFIRDDVDVNKIIASTVSTVRTLVGEKPVEVRLDKPEDLPVIRADEQRVRQILLNILSNAARFTEEGYIEIRARAEDSNIVIAVEDTGPGISREDQDSVFEAFKQTSSGLRKVGGTGLGMPISKNLAEILKGKLWLESEPGKGATFFVSLPIRSEELELTL